VSVKAQTANSTCEIQSIKHKQIEKQEKKKSSVTPKTTSEN